METISLKIDSKLLKEIDSNLVINRYSTRTEFIRDAIRNKIEDLEKQKAIENVRKFYGSSKRKTTDEELHKVRKEISKELMKDLE
ncbi:MAG TPA: ribbon-helix-helix domain-containing protein [Candidatus Nanoarchaeia archaeon]|nr:ribbon-helix-helix domain-containing protein [Candidatus Nanoarchaeia archaeon]